jgi:hypothetical protein
MSERKGLQVIGALLLAVAGIFACYLVGQVVEIYQLFGNWAFKENYLHDVNNVCRLFLWALGAHWVWKTFRAGLNLVSLEDSNEKGRPQQQNRPQQNHNQGGGGQQNGQNGGQRLPQQLQVKK